MHAGAAGASEARASGAATGPQRSWKPSGDGWAGAGPKGSGAAAQRPSAHSAHTTPLHTTDQTVCDEPPPEEKEFLPLSARLKAKKQRRSLASSGRASILQAPDATQPQPLQQQAHSGESVQQAHGQLQPGAGAQAQSAHVHTGPRHRLSGASHAAQGVQVGSADSAWQGGQGVGEGPYGADYAGPTHQHTTAADQHGRAPYQATQDVPLTHRVAKRATHKNMAAHQGLANGPQEYGGHVEHVGVGDHVGEGVTECDAEEPPVCATQDDVVLAARMCRASGGLHAGPARARCHERPFVGQERVPRPARTPRIVTPPRRRRWRQRRARMTLPLRLVKTRTPTLTTTTIMTLMQVGCRSSLICPCTLQPGTKDVAASPPLTITLTSRSPATSHGSMTDIRQLSQTCGVPRMRTLGGVMGGVLGRMGMRQRGRTNVLTKAGHPRVILGSQATHRP